MKIRFFCPICVESFSSYREWKRHHSRMRIGMFRTIFGFLCAAQIKIFFDGPRSELYYRVRNK